jgi:two-component system nitrate/nitrite response regulator NarL
MSRRNALILASNQLLREALKLGLKRSPLVVTGEGRDLDEAREQSADVPDIVIVIGTNSGSIDAALEEVRKAGAIYPEVKCAIVADQFSLEEILRALQAGVDAVLSMDASLSTILSSLKLVLMGQQVFPTLPLHLLVLQNKSLQDEIRPDPHTNHTSQTSPPGGIASNSVPSTQHGGFSRDDAVPSLPQSTVSGGGEDLAGPLVLSDREQQILRCLVNGQPNKVIARELGIAETTVKVHVKSVLRKIRASNRTQAAMWAVNQHLIQPGSEPGPGLMNGLSDKSYTG